MSKTSNIKENENENHIFLFFCFQIDKTIENGEFSFDNENLKYKAYCHDNLCVLKVCIEKNNSIFSKKLELKIIYKYNNENFECKSKIIEIKANKFFFFSENDFQKTYDSFKSPDFLTQYTAFEKCIEKYNDFRKDLISSTISFFKNNFELGFYIKISEDNEYPKAEIQKILNNFSSKRIFINRSQKYSFKSSKKGKELLSNDIRFIIIYSVITDYTDQLSEIIIEDKDLNIIFDYNEKNKDHEIKIKKSIFTNFISHIKDINNIKLLCKYCDSMAILFDFLSSTNISEKLKKKLKGQLKFSDLPKNDIEKDDILELIEKYQKIKNFFYKDSIISLWEDCINKYKKKKINKENIEILKNIKEKLESTDKELYKYIIKETDEEIKILRKKLISSKELKGKELYEFIYEYNPECDFFSDEKILFDISTNVDIKELGDNKDAYEAFNRCGFLSRLGDKCLVTFITGILNRIHLYNDLDIFFRTIYPLKIDEIETKDNTKDNIISKIIISHFLHLVNNSNKRIEFDDKFKDILKTIILLSVKYIKDKEDNNYEDLIDKLGNISAFDKDDLIRCLIQKFINDDVEVYVHDKKSIICSNILNKFFFKLSINQKISFLPEIKSLEFKEKYIYETFAKLQYEDFLEYDVKESFVYLKNYILSNIIKEDSQYFKGINKICNTIYEKFEKKNINFLDVKRLKELIEKEKLSSKIYCLCLSDKEKALNLYNNIKKYVDDYINYYNILDDLIKYYNKYYKNSKKSEIDKFLQIQNHMKQKNTNISDIKINEKYEEDSKKFEKYEKSKFFNYFFNEIDIEDEINKFNKTVETLDKCKGLFDDQYFEISLLEKSLSKFENKESLTQEIKMN